MLTNVPQYIDVEDKIAGPLTAKQLFWLLGLGAVIFILWMVIPVKGLFFLVAIPIVLVFIALAFYKPFGQPLGGFVLHGFSFLFSPKVYVWRRIPQKNTFVRNTGNQKIASVAVQDKTLTQVQLSALAHVLDTDGAARDREAVELIRQHEIRMAPKQKTGQLFGNNRNAQEINRQAGLQGEIPKQSSGSEDQTAQHRNFGDFLNM